MWLIDTRTLKLCDIIDPEEAGIRYAILSHTWGTPQEEVSFKDFADLDSARKKIGFAKIEKTCELARSQGLQYAWVDTCCIDKSSSAELSEAINSMFQWYRWSEICYVFLADLHGEPYDIDRWHTQSDSQEADEWSLSLKIDRDHHFLNSNFARCRWFTRGWTLQELIAPRKAVFYDSQWRRFASKHDIAPILSLITDIHEDILVGRDALGNVSVFTRMSWAARRTTTRVEDTAYCLLGIFDINFPLIYGEGPKAFRRLQEEIIRKTDDLSILAWSGQNPPGPKYRPRAFQNWVAGTNEYRGALAWAPCEFTPPPHHIEIGPMMEQGRFAPPGTLELDGARGVQLRNACIIHRMSKTTWGHAFSTDILQIPCLNDYVYRRLKRCPAGHVLEGPALGREELSLASDDVYDDVFELTEIVSAMTLLDLLAPKDAEDLKKPTVEIEVSIQLMEIQNINKYVIQSQPVWPVPRWSDVDRCFAMNPDELCSSSEVQLVAVQSVHQDIRGPDGRVHGIDVLCCIGSKPRDYVHTDAETHDLIVLTIVRDPASQASPLGRILDNVRMTKGLHWLDHKILRRGLSVAGEAEHTRSLPVLNTDGSSFEITLKSRIWERSFDGRRTKHHVQLAFDLPPGCSTTIAREGVLS